MLLRNKWIMEKAQRTQRGQRSQRMPSFCCQPVGVYFMCARLLRVGINPTLTHSQANNSFTRQLVYSFTKTLQ